MYRLDSAWADRWLATVVPSWLHSWGLPFLAGGGVVNWLQAADASWLVMLVCVGAAGVQLASPRPGCVLGVGGGVLAVVLEGDGDTLFSWIVFAVGCLVVLIWREVARTRQRDVSRRMSRDGIGVRVVFDDEERLALFTDDELQPRLVAFVGVDHPPELEDALAAAPDDDELKERITAAYLRRFAGPAVVRGALVEGTRPDIVTEAGTLHASGRLRARRKHETFDPLPDVAVSELGAPGVLPLLAGRLKVPDLPWRPKQAEALDAWNWFVVCALLVVGAAKVDDWLDSGKVDGFAVLVILALPFVPLAVIVDLCRRVVVDRDGLRVRGLLLDRTIPWSRVEAISRRSGGEVVLDLGDRTRTLCFDGENGRPSSRQVANVLRTVRAQAPATSAESSTRLSWGVFATLAYLAAIAAAAAYVVPRL